MNMNWKSVLPRRKRRMKKQVCDIRISWWIPLVLLIAVSLAACGGGGGEVAAPPVTPGVATGILTRGTGGITVNGIAFAVPAGTPIRVDDATATEAQLQDGMVVKVRGTFNAGVTTGTALKIEAEDEVEGPVSSPQPALNLFLVLGQSVVVDDLTVFVNTSGLSGASPIAANDNVEVHGLRDATGAIRASRVERKAQGQEDIEVKGIVSNLNVIPGTFNAGATFVTFDMAIAPAGLANGIRVEVKGTPAGTASLTATAIQREDLEDADFEPRDGETRSVEGLVSGVVGDIFSLDGKTVRKSEDTKFRNGNPDDLFDDIQVHATGTMNGTELAADRVSFRRTRVQVRGEVHAVDNVAQIVTLILIPVQVNFQTKLVGVDNLSSIVVHVQRMEMHGYTDTLGRVVADRLETVGGVGDEDNLIQGRVEDKFLSSIVVLGLQAAIVTSGPAATKLRDVNGQLLTFDAFFGMIIPSSVTPPGTLV